jgi:mannitol-specific phosphotransferase system IIBC component
MATLSRFVKDSSCLLFLPRERKKRNDKEREREREREERERESKRERKRMSTRKVYVIHAHISYACNAGLAFQD